MLNYLPERTYIAALPRDVRKLKAHPIVRYIGPLKPTDKLEARILNEGVNPFAARGDHLALTVVFFSDISPAQAQEAVELLGARIIERLDSFNVMRIELPKGSLQDLLASDRVEWVEDIFDGQTLNDGARANLRANPVQDAAYGLDGSGVKIGEWDAGLAGSHIDFGARITPGDGAILHSHATHVAGTAIGSGANSAQNGGSSLQWRGLAPNASIVSYNWSSYLSEYAGAIGTHDIDLSTNSWKAPLSNGSYSSESASLDAIVTGSQGKKLPILWAADNDREPQNGANNLCHVDLDGNRAPPSFDSFDCIASQASAKNVLTVGATDSDDDSMTTFSAWGPTDDGRLKPEITGPGCQAATFDKIWSTVPADSFQPNGGYYRSCGTSMSTPAVAGSAALLLERYRAVCPTSTEWLPSTLKALMVHAAVDLDDSSNWYNRGPDFSSGYGRLDVRKAVDMVPFHLVGTVTQSGDVRSYPIVVTPQKDLRITLAWDDPPAVPNASVSLVNNLDLELIDPLGGSHLPWVLSSSPASTLFDPATRGVDNRNVVEQVVVDDVPPGLAGTWTVKVKGTTLPTGSNQSFSLVSELLQTTSCTGGPPLADIWGMDLPTDTGNEPDSGIMWTSPDIRVSLDDIDGPHENPEWGQTNHVFITARNRGSQAAPYAKLFLYFAEANSGGLSWPNDWHLVGTTSATNVPPGAAMVADSIQWDPPGIGHFCLYVRMVTFDDPLNPETSDINLTTLQNNAVIWKNVSVVNLKDLQQGPSESTFVFGNPGTKQETFKLSFRETVNGGDVFIGRGEVIIDIGRELHARWRRSGAKLRGLAPVGRSSFRVIDAKRAELVDINLKGRERFPIGVRISGREVPQDSDFQFDIIQTSGSGKTNGGVHYDLH